jgi:RimJ/RimL family protein N-acetyltransferase
VAGQDTRVASPWRGAVVRAAVLNDVDAILKVQEPGAVLGLGHIFPQDQYPFPREEVAERWRAEIRDPAMAVYVSIDDQERVTGFGALQADELLHFGVAAELWGSGFAAWLHDELLRRMPPGLASARLRVFEDNRRARRFYEKNGWFESGVTSRSQFPPRPVLVEYRRNL